MTPPPLTLLDLQTRFLYPFFFDRKCVSDALGALQRLSIGKHSEIWVPSQPPSLYRDEVLDHVANYLYPGDERTDRCAYLIDFLRAGIRVVTNRGDEVSGAAERPRKSGHP